MPVVKKELCSGCGVCMFYCPEEAISMDSNRTAGIDHNQCSDCGKCQSVCPKNAVG